MAQALRGLATFISDVRNCQSNEAEQKRVEEELAKIRSKFKAGKLDSYSAKKYVAKLLYIYMLGFDFDFGQIEAVSLISGHKYSEKQMGYFACSLLLNENSELITLIVNTIGIDLAGKNEVHTCLALSAIANIGGKEMAESLTQTVANLLVGKTANPFIKKKAALTLLRLYRKWPEIITPSEWSERLLAQLDIPAGSSYGVCTAVTSLLLSLVAKFPLEFEGAVRKAIWLLHKIVKQREVPPPYLYYEIPVPWLQVKLLRLLQYYPPTDDKNMQQRLTQILQTIVANSDAKANPNYNNALNAVLFEAIDLIIHLDNEPELLIQSANLLGRFIQSKETNVRYLGLEKMAHLAVANHDSIEQIKRHQDVIIDSLKDPDISIRRRALDLLYSMCDRTNSEQIVRELLNYLQTADYNIRDELVLKIAILAEKFAVTYKWYIDTILELIAEGGDHVSDDIWYRVVQIVTNNEDLQQYAAKKTLKALLSPNCHEIAVKVAGYILGEFGHLLVDDPKTPAAVIFGALKTKFNIVSVATKALLLSTFIKFLVYFPDLRAPVVQILHSMDKEMDAELQQRACEYLVLIEQEAGKLPVVWDVMPAFPERESSVIIKALKKKDEGLTDSAPTVRGGDDSQGPIQSGVDADALRREEIPEHGLPTSVPAGEAALSGSGSRSRGLLEGVSEGVSLHHVSTAEHGASAGVPVGAVPTALVGLEPTVGHGAKPTTTNLLDIDLGGPSLPPGGGGKSGIDDLLGAVAAAAVPREPLNKDLAARLQFADQGVLYDDALVQIGVKAEFRNHQGRMALFYGNKTQVPLANFSATVSASDALSIQVQPLTVVPAGKQEQQPMMIECRAVFATPPTVQVTFNGNTLLLTLPVFTTKFIAPYNLSPPDFLAAWNSIGDAGQVKHFIRPADRVNVETAKAMLSGPARMALLAGVDPQPANVVAAGMWCSAGPKHPVCVLIETNASANLYRLTARCADSVVNEKVVALVVAQLGTIVQT